MKAILVSLSVLLLASSSNLKGVTDGQIDNYAALQQFLDGFMTAYAGSTYDVSTCLSPATQASLDQVLASTYGLILTGQFPAALTAYESFLTELSQACTQCGLMTVASSLNTGIAQKGQIWFEINLLYNAGDLEPLFKQLVTDLKTMQWTAVGTTFGQITAMVVPYTPSKLSMLQLDTLNYQRWWKGLVYGLSINPKKVGPCGSFLLTTGNQTIPVATDLSLLQSKNITGFNTLFGDLATLLTWYQKSYTVDFCNFEMLFSDIQAGFTTAGAAQIALRYATKAALINQDVQTIQNCEVDTYGCGQAFGTIVKDLLNWSIN